VYVNIGLVSYLPKVGGSIASFIVNLALARTGLRTKQNTTNRFNIYIDKRISLLN
jgi:hypothetical protein